jgi:hypothetical protein
VARIRRVLLEKSRATNVVVPSACSQHFLFFCSDTIFDRGKGLIVA